MFENLLAAFYLSGGGSFDYQPDPKDGYGDKMHMEPRYSVGAGLSFDPSDRIEVDMGYRFIAMPPLPGHNGDPLDRFHSFYLEVRFRPFRR
jgi:opacity protein-like surface antigen